MLAVMDDSPEIVEALLAKGADTAAREKYRGDTALNKAIVAGNLSGTESSLSHQADPNTVDQTGYTVLMQAARLNEAAIVDALLGNKADVNAKDKDGLTALNVCSGCGVSWHHQGFAVERP